MSVVEMRTDLRAPSEVVVVLSMAIIALPSAILARSPASSLVEYCTLPCVGSASEKLDCCQSLQTEVFMSQKRLQIPPIKEFVALIGFRKFEASFDGGAFCFFAFRG